MSELDLLRRLGDQIMPPSLDALRDTARRRTRQGRVAISLAIAAGVVAATGTGVLVTRPEHRSQEPITPPPTPSSRPLTYADGNTIYYGNRTVEADRPVVELDVTDDGVAFRTNDGRLWFSDGTTTAALGDVGETGPGYGQNAWPMMTRPGWMLSANSGSRLVWFTFPAPGEPEVVVYDTKTQHEVARDAVELQPGHTALPALVSERYVYWFQDADPEAMPGEQKHQVRYDPATREQSRVTEAELLDDLDTEAAVRSIRLKGDDRSEVGFHFSDGMGQQMDLGLEQEVAGVNGVAPVGPGDMKAEDVNRETFVFDPPPGYTHKAGVSWLVQWLDDHTVVVLSPLRDGTDLITCDLVTNSCRVAASAPAGIVAPDFGKAPFIG